MTLIWRIHTDSPSVEFTPGADAQTGKLKLEL
jgi:hypothetical protein